MKTVHKLALAAGLPAVAIATFGQAASAAGAAPTTTPPAPSIPADWQVLVDDTGQITLAAPAEWTDLDTVPGTNADGTPRPWIEASTDIASFHETFETAGVVLAAIPHSADLQATLDEFDVGACADQVVEPYTSATFTGLIEHQDCGAGIEYYRLAVDSTANPAVTLLLQIGLTGAEDEGTADTIIASMNFAGGSTTPATTPATPTLAPVPTVPGVTTPSTAAPVTAPATPTTAATGQTLAPATVPGATTVPGTPTVPGGAATLPALPTAPGAPTTAAGTPPETVAGAVPLTDDTGRLSIAVPPTWTEIVTSPTDDGNPYISASPNQAVFQSADASSFTTPGVIYSARPFTADTQTAVSSVTDGSLCTDGGIVDYDDGVFVGHAQIFTDCGGTAARMYIIVANPADSSFTAVLLIQVVDAGDAELNTIVGSFNTVAAG